LTCGPVKAIDAANAKGMPNILRQSKRHGLRDTQARALFEANVEVDVHDLAGDCIDQQVVKMAVAKPNDIADH
jgi:hypothetical protein